jgi:hypothetical protein
VRDLTASIFGRSRRSIGTPRATKASAQSPIPRLEFGRLYKVRSENLPQQGLRTQPRVSALGTDHPEGAADRTGKYHSGRVRLQHLSLDSILGNNRCEIQLAASRPFKANRLFEGSQG